MLYGWKAVGLSYEKLSRDKKVSAQTTLHVTIPGITYGVGVNGVGAAGVPASAVGIGVEVGAFKSTVGTAIVGKADGRGAPVNRKTVPSTMLTATRPFNPIEAYQRQLFFCDFGFALRGIPNSFNF